MAVVAGCAEGIISGCGVSFLDAGRGAGVGFLLGCCGPVLPLNTISSSLSDDGEGGTSFDADASLIDGGWTDGVGAVTEIGSGRDFSMG